MLFKYNLLVSDQLKQVDDLIHQMLCEKKKILSRICPMLSLNTDDKSEVGKLSSDLSILYHTFLKQ